MIDLDIERQVFIIIKESDVLSIVDIDSGDYAFAKDIIAQEYIGISNNGEGYLFLLRYEKPDKNFIFQSKVIEKINDGFLIKGYFKDTMIVNVSKYENSLIESCLDYQTIQEILFKNIISLK